jgi:hypothetical protein
MLVSAGIAARRIAPVALHVRWHCKNEREVTVMAKFLISASYTPDGHVGWRCRCASSERCRTQAAGAIESLAAESWPIDARPDQAEITTTCMICYVRMTDPELIPPGRYPALDALSSRCEARPEFAATYPAEYVVPRDAMP